MKDHEYSSLRKEEDYIYFMSYSFDADLGDSLVEINS